MVDGVGKNEGLWSKGCLKVIPELTVGTDDVLNGLFEYGVMYGLAVCSELLVP